MSKTMTKHYTTKKLSELSGTSQDVLKIQLQRDAKKPRSQRKYPHARKCECGHGWLIPAKDLNKN
jgi:hypothetical protein